MVNQLNEALKGCIADDEKPTLLLDAAVFDLAFGPERTAFRTVFVLV